MGDLVSLSLTSGKFAQLFSVRVRQVIVSPSRFFGIVTTTTTNIQYTTPATDINRSILPGLYASGTNP